MSNTVKNPMIRERIEDVKLAAIKDQSRNALIEHKRALELCFKYAEKYYSEHQYKIKIHVTWSRIGGCGRRTK
jgi:hypothetical protein